MEFEPKSLVFKEIKLNQVYSTSLCISNPLPAAAELTIRASSPRLSTTPSSINIAAGQSIVVTVKLMLHHYPSKDAKVIEDHIMVKSTFFDHKIPVRVYTTPTTPRSRSPSPVRKDLLSSESARDLRMQLDLKDRRVEELEAVIGKLESKYPDLQDIVASRVEAERLSFEEKSEKILQILKRKDMQIAALEKQVQDRDDTIQAYRQTYVQEKDRETSPGAAGRKIPRTGPSDELLRQNKELEVDLAEATATARRLQEELDSMRAQRQEAGVSTRLQAQTREMLALRGQVSDQAEQIEALLGELSKRQEEDRAVEERLQEMSYLRADKTALAKRLQDADKRFAELQAAYNLLSSERASSGLQALQALGAGLEDQVEGGLATSTPYHYDNPPVASIARESTQQGLHRRCSELQSRLDDAIACEADLRDRLTRCEEEAQVLRAHNAALQTQLHQATPPQHVDSPIPALSTVQGDSPPKSSSNDLGREVHEWWSYVWHATQEKLSFAAAHAPARKPGDLEFSAQDREEALLHIAKLRENVQKIAAELAVSRQEALQLRLQQRSATRRLEATVASLQRDYKQLIFKAGKEKQDKETYIAGLQQQIRTLSSRSDVHGQVFALQRDLDNEKLLNQSLHLDVYKHAHALEEHSKRVRELEYSQQLLQNQVDSVDLVKTLVHIPGVDVAQAIQICAEELQTSKTQVGKLNGTVAELQQQLATQQRQLSNAANLASTLSHTGAATGVSRRPKSPSPTPRRPSVAAAALNASLMSPPAFHAEDLDSPEAADAALHPDECLDTGLLRHVKRLVVEEDTTPSSLLEAVDKAVLVNQLAQQDAVIRDLQAQIDGLPPVPVASPLKDGLAADEDYLIVTRAEKAELDATAHRLLLSDQRLQELGAQVAQLGEQKKQLEKDLIAAKVEATPRAPAVGDQAWDASSVDGEGEEKHDGSAVADPDLRALVKQRDTQIQILTETLEALHIHPVQPDEPSSGGGDSAALVDDRRNPDRDHNYVIYVLIQRVLELTADLTTLRSEQALALHGQGERDKKYARLVRQLNRFKAQMAAVEEENERLRQQSDARQHDLVQQEHAHIDRYHQLRDDHERLTQMAQEYIYANERLKHDLADVQHQLQAVTQEGVPLLVQEVCADLQLMNAELRPSAGPAEPPVATQDASTASLAPSCDGLQGLVADLLTRWKEADQSKAAATFNKPGSKLTKAEQKFLSRVSSLLMASHQRLQSLQQHVHALHSENRRLTRDQDALRRHVAVCAQQLLVYKNRVGLCLKVQQSDALAGPARDSQLVSLLKRHVAGVQQENHAAHMQLFHVKRALAAQACERLQQANAAQRLSAKLLYLEAQGPKSAQVKEQVLGGMHVYLDGVYKRVEDWFKKELYMLVHNLPVADLLPADYLATHLPPDGSEGGSLGAGTRVEDILRTQGADQSYLLSQTVCQLKAQLTHKDLSLYHLTQQLALYKDKYAYVDGVLYKYKGVLQRHGLDADAPEGQAADSLIHVEDAQKMCQLGLEKEVLFVQKIHQLEQERVLLEEAHIEAKNRAELCTQQVQQYRQLVQEYAHAEQRGKQVYVQNMTRLRIGLENEYVQQMRQVREAYEHERAQYVDELNRLAQAVQEAHAFAGDCPEGAGAGQVAVQVRWPPAPAPGRSEHLRAPDVRLFDDLVSVSNADGSSALRRADAETGTAHAAAPTTPPAGIQAPLQIAEEQLLEPEPPLLFPEIGRSGEVRSSVAPPLGPAAPAPGVTAPSVGIAGRLDSSVSVHSAQSAPSPSSNSELLRAIDHIAEAVDTPSSSSADQSYVLRMQAEKLQRLLELERRKVTETKLEAQELQAQVSALRDAMAQAQATAPPAATPADLVRRLQEEARKEDPALWPGASVLLQDLLGQLQLLYRRLEGSAESDLLRAAIAQACRLQEIRAGLGSQPQGPQFVTNSIAELSQQIAQLETSLHPPGVDQGPHPMDEKYLHLLRDLRARVHSLDEAFQHTLVAERGQHDQERAELLARLRGLEEECALRPAGPGGAIQQQYSDLVQQLEEDYRRQLEVARGEVRRLEEALAAKMAAMAELEVRNQQLTAFVRGAEPAAEEVLRLRHASAQSQAQLQEQARGHHEDMARLQRHFLQYKHVQEEVIGALEEQVEELYSQQSASQSSFGQRLGDLDRLGEIAGAGESEGRPLREGYIQRDLEERVRRMEYLYRSKCGELEAMVRAVGDRFSQGIAAGLPQDAGEGSSLFSIPEHPIAPPPPPTYTAGAGPTTMEFARMGGHPSATRAPSAPGPGPGGWAGDEMERTSEGEESQGAVSTDLQQIKQQLATARLQSAEREVATLQRQVFVFKQKALHLEERLRAFEASPTQAHAQAPAQAPGPIPAPAPAPAPPVASAPASSDRSLAGAEAFLRDQTKDFTLPLSIEESEATRSFLRRVNAVRREARALVAALRDQVLALSEATATDAHPTGAGGASSGPTVAALREENARKQKLLQVYRAQKQADANALEQWKHEARALDEQSKRLQRTLAAKEALVRDLRVRLEGPDPQPAPLDELHYSSLTVQEMRTKLKECDLERSRMRTRLQALKDRVAELEAQAVALGQENDKLKAAIDKHASLKQALQHKDSAITALRQATERLKAEAEQARQQEARLQQSSERRIKQLQRQIDGALRLQDDQARETSMLRERLAQTHLEAPQATSAPVSTAPAPQPPSRDPERQATRMSVRPNSATADWPFDASGDQSSIRAPASLHDVRDVLQEFSGLATPSPMGLSAISTPSTAGSAGASGGPGASAMSVERRLQALVDQAMQSPARRDVARR